MGIFGCPLFHLPFLILYLGVLGGVGCDMADLMGWVGRFVFFIWRGGFDSFGGHIFARSEIVNRGVGDGWYWLANALDIDWGSSSLIIPSLRFSFFFPFVYISRGERGLFFFFSLPSLSSFPPRFFFSLCTARLQWNLSLELVFCR